MRDVVIIDAIRSPIGKFGGALSTVRPDDLLADVLKGLMKRTGIDPDPVSYTHLTLPTKCSL